MCLSFFVRLDGQQPTTGVPHPSTRRFSLSKIERQASKEDHRAVRDVDSKLLQENTDIQSKVRRKEKLSILTN